MNPEEVLINRVDQELKRSNIFSITLPKGRGEIILQEDKKFITSDGQEGAWSLKIDDNYTITLILKQQEVLWTTAILNGAGHFLGRDRINQGFLTIYSKDTTEWRKLAKPVRIFETVKIEGEDEEFNYSEHLAPRLNWDFLESYDLNVILPEQLPRDTAIVVVGFDRTGYFGRTLESIARNPEAKDFPLFVFLDQPVIDANAVIKEQVALVEKHFEGKLNTYIIVRPKNAGCGRNIIDARRQIFDNAGFKKAFIFEDDMVISPTYMGLCLRLLNWAQSMYSNVGVVQAWNHCLLPLISKQENQHAIKATFSNLWGYLITKECWDDIKTFMYRYQELFLFCEYGKRPNRSIRKWFRLKLKKQLPEIHGDESYKYSESEEKEAANYLDNPPTGQDAATIHALYLKGWTRLATVVNRAEYIGKRGIHMNENLFATHKLGEVRNDLFPTDVGVVGFTENIIPAVKQKSPVRGFSYEGR